MIRTPKSGQGKKTPVHFFCIWYNTYHVTNPYMSKRIYTREEQAAVAANEHVKRCSERAITYTEAFKRQAVRQYDEGWSSKEIFIQAGFPMDLIGAHTPKQCLARWRRTVKQKGVEGLVESRGNIGRPKTRNLSKDQKIDYLEAQVAYLKAENDFLAKLRAKRRAE